MNEYTPKYKKITVIIEDSLEIVTVVFPRVVSQEWSVEYEDPEDLDGVTRTTRERQITGVTLDLKPLQDETTGQIYITKSEFKIRTANEPPTARPKNSRSLAQEV